ncbi:alpha/beta fold hydrolase [Rhizobium sp. RU36D]|uniref:alpha/beta hydrolase n=1 Tax=Rhizobium sp. RU36D TaxID=1907415 RepID=UPI0009D91217|nr:alpha/beta fold hydrolase [Rhizobium sp. RU36D]SMC80734.1 Lysophospholipase, alpha-beta hydrolase superfamily [Rhizobium sp. RU36D]
MPSFRRRVTRLAFSTLSKVSPVTAGRLALALFCRTPPKSAKAGKARTALDTGRKLLAQAGVSSHPLAFSLTGQSVMTHRLAGASPSAKRVLVLHGWGSRSEYLARMALEIHATGAEVVMMDLPGHGGSSGRHLHLRSAAEAIAAVNRTYGPFDGAVAHSFGGASLMVAVGGVFPCVPRFDVGRIVLVGAPTEIESRFAWVSRELGLNSAASADLIRRAEGIGGVSLAALDTIPIARSLRVPILVVHAEDDKEVDVQHARRYEGATPTLRFHWANGFGHRRIVSAPSVVAHVASFLVDVEPRAA